MPIKIMSRFFNYFIMWLNSCTAADLYYSLSQCAEYERAIFQPSTTQFFKKIVFSFFFSFPTFCCFVFRFGRIFQPTKKIQITNVFVVFIVVVVRSVQFAIKFSICHLLICCLFLFITWLLLCCCWFLSRLKSIARVIWRLWLKIFFRQ